MGSDASLRHIAEIVHDIDLKDKKFNRLEAFGLDTIVRGLPRVTKDDRSLLNHCFLIFDGLYKYFSRSHDEGSAIEKSDGKSSKGKKNDKRTR